MLALLNLKKIKFEKVAPFDEDNLVYFVNQSEALVFKNIVNGDQEYFSIKNIMIDSKNADVFACLDFESAQKEFAKIVKTRLERFFATGKSRYIFFDEQEQSFLENLIARNNLTCLVEMYSFNGKSFNKIEFEKISSDDFNKSREEMKKLGVTYVLSPEVFLRMRGAGMKRSPGDFKKKEDALLKKIFDVYPEFEVTNKKDFQRAYKKISFELHPDTGGDIELFQNFSQCVDAIKKTSWFSKLEDDE